MSTAFLPPPQPAAMAINLPRQWHHYFGVANTEVSNNRAVITWDTTNNASSWVVYSTTSNLLRRLLRARPAIGYGSFGYGSDSLRPPSITIMSILYITA